MAATLACSLLLSSGSTVLTTLVSSPATRVLTPMATRTDQRRSLMHVRLSCLDPQGAGRGAQGAGGVLATTQPAPCPLRPSPYQERYEPLRPFARRSRRAPAHARRGRARRRGAAHRRPRRGARTRR